jgi:soluble lytic murein transglycosylase-like protein
MLPLLLILLFVITIPHNSIAHIYKYVAEDGTVYYTNMPMAKKAKPSVKSEDARPVKTSFNFKRPEKIDKSSYYTIAEEKARQYNLDPKLLKAVIRAESNWNPTAVSPKGAMGLMQLIPSTAVLMGVQNPFDPAENIDGGVRYLKHLLERFNGNLVLALAAYNAGPKLVEKKSAVPSIPETVDYVKRVLTYYNGNPSYQLYASIEREIKQEIVRIRKVIQEDGTILFTNSQIY